MYAALMRARNPLRSFTHQSLLAGLTLVASLAYTGLAGAESYLAAEPMTSKVRVDGMLRDWPGGFAKLSHHDKGSGGSGEALVGYDKSTIYLAAKVNDTAIVRTKSGGQREDRLTLDIFIPSANGRGGSSHTISVFPGDPGKLPGLVQVDGKTVTSAKAVEAPTDSGLIIEAQIPWSALPAAASVRVGLRGRLSYHDATALGRIARVYSTGQGRGQAMPPLTLEPETGLIQTLLEPKRLSLSPAREAYGDVTGKGGVERVALYGHFLSIVGPGYKDGKQFYFNELDVDSEKRVLRLELRDMNGDGKSEIILEKRVGPSERYRDVLQILTVGKDGAPLQVFAHEVSLVTPEGKVSNKVTFSGSGKGATVEIAQGKAEGFEPGSFSEPTIGGGIHSALLPWQTVGARVYGWQGDGLAQIEERTWEPKVKGDAVARRDPAVKAPPPPRAPTQEEMLDRVYALYRGDRGVGGKKPAFDLVTDVVEDDQMERVLIHDRDLVIFGKGFKKGLSYTFLTIGVKESKDILSVTTRDLVGDGKAEIIVHAVLNAQASKQLGGDVVQRQALFVYKVVGENLTRIFAAETGRSLNGNRILGGARFVPSGNSVKIELRPLTAIGWTKKNYPFPEDTQPAGGLEPLLLPWGTLSPQTYEFSAGSYNRSH